MKYKSKFGKVCCCLVFLVSLVGVLSNVEVAALEDGAYTVGRTSTYINPDTGLTSKGAQSNETGEKMSANILAPEVLVEQSAGKTYVTIGLGMSSSISNVQIQVQTAAGGGYQSVAYTNTGSSSLNGDTCMHYRFEVVSPYLNISPKFSVDGMGMELEFYIILDMNNAVAGSSIYASEMVASAQNTQAEVESEPASPTAEEIAAAEALAAEQAKLAALMDPNQDPLDKAQGLSTHFIMRKKDSTTTSNNTALYVGVGLVLVLALGGVGFYVYQKRRRVAS